MYRVLYFDYMGLFDVSFGFNSQHEARKYAQKHSVELQQEIGRKVRFSIKKIIGQDWAVYTLNTPDRRRHSLTI